MGLALLKSFYLTSSPPPASKPVKLVQFGERAENDLVNTSNNSIYLLARSPRSNSAQYIWSQLPYFADRQFKLYVIFHRRDNFWSARRAVNEFKSAFGPDASIKDHVKLARDDIVGSLFETLQIGQVANWAGNQMSLPPNKSASIEAQHMQDSSEFDVKMFRQTFGKVWAISKPFY